MTGSPRMQRAFLLLEQGRHELAEQELRGHLASDPTDGTGHAVLALVLVDLERLDEAEASARTAVGHEPDLAFAHHALGLVLSRRNRLDEAERAIREAIRLSPASAESHAVLGGIEFRRRRWPAALEAAELGLQFDPEHVGCTNLRAMALVKLGRKSEAGATIDQALARDPEDALSHANMGWTLLEHGQPKQAMEHFRESLRLDPSNEWAKAGLVEAIKAGNPLYALLLRYFLWMRKLSSRAGWAVILLGYVAYQGLRGFARANAEWAPLVLPLIVLYVAFCLLTWLAAPLFDLALFLHPLGKHALSVDQTRRARLVGSALALALTCVLLELVVPGDASFVLLALAFGLLSLPASAVHACSPGWPRKAMAGITTGLAVVGVGASAVLGLVRPVEGSPLEMLGILWLVCFLLGIFASQFIANFLMGHEPAR